MKRFKILFALGLLVSVVSIPAMAQTVEGADDQGPMRGDVTELSDEWALALNTSTDVWLDAEIEAEIEAELEAELEWEDELMSDIDWLEIDEDEWDWDLELEMEDVMEWEEELDTLFLDSEESDHTEQLEQELEKEIEQNCECD